MVSPVDFDSIPGWRRNDGPPDDFIPTNLRLWDTNEFTHARLAAYMQEDGLVGFRTNHRIRALDLIGATALIGGGPFVAGYPGMGEPDIRYHFPEEATYTVTDLHGAVAGTLVRLRFHGTGNLAGSRHIDVSVNGVFLYEIAGNADGNGFLEYLTLTAEQWNSILPDDGVLTFAFVPTSVPFVASNYVKIRLEYTAAPTEVHGFANDEVTYPHVYAGFRMRGDGLLEPVVIYQADDGWPPMAAVGVAHMIQEGDRPELGAAGLVAFSCPIKTPESHESQLAAYPVVCGQPV